MYSKQEKMRAILISICALWSFATYAQSDKTTFHTYLYNKEYKVYLRINFYDQDVIIPDRPDRCSRRLRQIS